jgi:hypothetical protein
MEITDHSKSSWKDHIHFSRADKYYFILLYWKNIEIIRWQTSSITFPFAIFPIFSKITLKNRNGLDFPISFLSKFYFSSEMEICSRGFKIFCMNIIFLPFTWFPVTVKLLVSDGKYRPLYGLSLGKQTSHCKCMKIQQFLQILTKN